MKYLYKKIRSDDEGIIIDNLNVEIFIPRIWRGLILPNEKKSFRLICVRLVFQLMTHGRARIYYATQNGELVHTSYVIPKCMKFPFLGSNDYEIGPCFTYPKYRGKGVYPAMLRRICNSVGMENSVFYMIVDAANTSSIKGIEKAGFEKCGFVRVTGILKIYQVEQQS